jgi:hypothetical protein
VVTISDTFDGPPIVSGDASPEPTAAETVEADNSFTVMFGRQSLAGQMKPAPFALNAYRIVSADVLKFIGSGQKFTIPGFTSVTLEKQKIKNLVRKGEILVYVTVAKGVKAVYHKSSICNELLLEQGLQFTVEWASPQALVLLAEQGQGAV